MLKINNSSNIEAVDYNQEEKILKVEFKGGAQYEYLDVEAPKYTNIVDNNDLPEASVGKYINSEIKPHYKVRQVVTKAALEKVLKKTLKDNFRPENAQQWNDAVIEVVDDLKEAFGLEVITI